MSQQGPLNTASGGGGSYLPGNVVQTIVTSTGAMLSTSVVLPNDDTIPQQTEGTEFVTATITPTKATNLLYINFTSMYEVRDVTSNAGAQVALFQDATANALRAASMGLSPQANVRSLGTASMLHTLTAGTTSPTTFKIRVGVTINTDVLTMNGIDAGRLYAGVASTNLIIQELEV